MAAHRRVGAYCRGLVDREAAWSGPGAASRPWVMASVAVLAIAALLYVAVSGSATLTASALLVLGMYALADVVVIDVSDTVSWTFSELFIVLGVFILPPSQFALVVLIAGGLKLLDRTNDRNATWGEILVTEAYFGAFVATMLAVGASLIHAFPSASLGSVLVIATVAYAASCCVHAVIAVVAGPVSAVESGDEETPATLWQRCVVTLRASIAPMVIHVPMGALAVLAWSANMYSVTVLMLPIIAAAVVARRVQQLKDAERRAQTDPLTGLANRARFLTRVDSEMELASRYGHGLALIMGDLDNFKRVNDTRGHLAGDHVLRATATAMQRVIDESLFPLARYGGEEFVIALPACGRDDVLSVAEKLRAEIESSLAEWGTSISLGVSYLQEHDRLESLVDRADKALYSAKYAGKNRVHEWPNGANNGPSPISGMRDKGDAAAA